MDNKNVNGHSQATLDMLANAVAAGKFTQEQADNLLEISSTDKNVLDALKGVIRKSPIKLPLVKGNIHHTLLETAANKTYDEIQQTEPGTLTTLAEQAPELYKAKFFEKYGRLPAVLPVSRP